MTRYDFTYLIALLAVRTGFPNAEYLTVVSSLLLGGRDVRSEDTKRMEKGGRVSRAK